MTFMIHVKILANIIGSFIERRASGQPSAVTAGPNRNADELQVQAMFAFPSTKCFCGPGSATK